MLKTVQFLDKPLILWFSAAAFLAGGALAAWILDLLIARHLPKAAPGTDAEDSADKLPKVRSLLRRLVRSLVWIFSVVMALRALGFNISALLAGLGLGGAALALSSKDTLANFFGAITVFFDKPFKMHDHIKILGYEGIIVEMNLRTSRIRTGDNRIVTIPNSVFPSNPIENFSLEPFVKVTETINLQAANGRGKAEEALGILRACASPGAPQSQATITSISGAVYSVSFSFFVSRDVDYFSMVNTMNLEILRLFEQAGIKLA